MAFASIASDALLRGGLLACLFLALALAETVLPARPRTLARRQRWIANGGLFLAATFAQRLAAPAGLVGVAAWAQGAGLGLFNLLAAPPALAMILSIAALDLALYAQHFAMHRNAFLWRVHAPHHADPDLDVTTGLRFHPFEFLISLAWKAAIVVILGAPLEAVLLFEIALSAFSLWTHASVRLPAPAERALRLFLVTPHLHRLHHDRARGMRAPNFGFSTPLWDRLFGTYCADPEPEALGLEGVGAQGWRLGRSLVLPLRQSLLR